MTAESATDGEDPTLVWLDALASERCTTKAFLRAMRERFHDNADANWEVLSLLDQYYRRGKLKREIFQTLKSQLQDSALSAEGDAPAAARPDPSPHSPPPTAPPTLTSAVASRAASPPAPASAASSPPASPPPASPPPAASQPSASQPSASQSAASRFAASQPTAPRSAAPSTTASLPVPPAGIAPPRIKPAKPRAAGREVADGDVLRNRYRVIRVLGRGGMGTVFEAADEYRLDLLPAGQRIAIKVLHSAVTAREELLCELQREFQHLQSLSHPHIVRVHEFDRDGDAAFFTMELLNGALLSAVLNARHAAILPPGDALAIIRDVGAALAHAHSRGVVHGDINPQNIFITNEGELRVLDFGAAHSMRRTDWAEDNEPTLSAPVATPGYASCEVLEGQRPDARDDVFAFACVIYLLLSGKHPFPGCNAVEARSKRIRVRRPDGLTGAQWRVLREGLNWDRARRPSDVQNWLDRLSLQGAAPRLPLLSNLMTGAAPRSNRAWLTAAVILWLALLAAGGYWLATNYDSVSATVAATVAGWHLPGSSDSPRAEQPPASSDSVPTTAAPQTAPPASAPTPTATAPARPPMPEPVHAPPPTRSAAPAAVAAPRLPSAARTAAVPATSSAEKSASAAVVSGAVRIEMMADTVDVLANERSAHVTVRRRGNPHGAASFIWWTESGTAKPGVDFVPVMPHTEAIADGSNGVVLDISVTSGSRRVAKSFYVVIDRVESGAALGTRTLTMVTIQPPD